MPRPNLDGLGLVEALKAQYPLIPVKLMTAAGSKVFALYTWQAGAASHVSWMFKCRAWEASKAILAEEQYRTLESLAASDSRRTKGSLSGRTAYGR